MADFSVFHTTASWKTACTKEGYERIFCDICLGFIFFVCVCVSKNDSYSQCSFESTVLQWPVAVNQVSYFGPQLSLQAQERTSRQHQQLPKAELLQVNRLSTRSLACLKADEIFVNIVRDLSPLVSLIVEPVIRAPTTRSATRATTVTAAVTTKPVAKTAAGTFFHLSDLLKMPWSPLICA